MAPSIEGSPIGTHPKKWLAVAFTREDILQLLKHADCSRMVILYHGMGRDRYLEAKATNLFFANDFLDFDLIAAMRSPVINSITNMTGRSGPLWHYQNNIFFSIVQYIGMLAAGIVALVARFDPQELLILGDDISAYMPVQEAEGEVVRRFEWFPERFYPRYASQIAKSLGKTFRLMPTAKKRPFCGLRAKLRPALLDMGKALFLIRRNLRLFGMRALLQTQAEMPAGPIDTLVLVRSNAGVDYLKGYVRWLVDRGRTVVLVVGEQLQRTGTLVYLRTQLPDIPVVHMPLYEHPWKVMGEFLRSRFRTHRISKSATVELIYGPARFKLEIGLIARHLARSTCDQRVYQGAISTILDTLHGRKPVCVSAEIMTFYPSVEAEAALKRGLVFWNTEPGPFDKRYALRVAPGTGYAVQSVPGEAAARRAIPWEADRIYHPGCLTDPSLEIMPRVRKKTLRSVVLYTQPQPASEENNYAIGDALVKMGHRIGYRLIVKPHPRDYNIYHGRWTAPFVRIADRLGERSEYLTRDADCVISVASSTLSEALLLGVPYMSVLLEEQFRQVEMESLAQELGVRHHSIDEMEAHLLEFESYARRYYHLRADFLRRSIRVPLQELGHPAAMRLHIPSASKNPE